MDREKLKKLRSALYFSQKEMADLLGIKQNTYSCIESGKVSFTDRNKKTLASALGFSSSWFDKENTTMFLMKNPLSDLISENDWGMLKENKDKEAVRNAAFETIQIWKNPLLTTDSRLKMKLSYATLTTDSKPNSISTKSETRPRIPYAAAAGSLTSSVEGVTEIQCEQIPLIAAFPTYDFTILIKGDSMYPNYEGGDEVACKRIDSTSFIQWGKVHVLDTAQGIVIKRVYEDGEDVKCVSYNKEYPDFTIAKDEVYSMSLVVGLLRL